MEETSNMIVGDLVPIWTHCPSFPQLKMELSTSLPIQQIDRSARSILPRNKTSPTAYWTPSTINEQLDPISLNVRAPGTTWALEKEGTRRMYFMSGFETQFRPGSSIRFVPRGRAGLE